MRRFRIRAAEGVYVADGVRFEDGAVVLRVSGWPHEPRFEIYPSMEALNHTNWQIYRAIWLDPVPKNRKAAEQE